MGVGFVFGLNSMIVFLWCYYPKQYRSDPGIRKYTLLSLLIIGIICPFNNVVYYGVLKLFQYVEDDNQWPLVIVIILVRELTNWAISYVNKKIAGYEDISTEIYATFFSVIRHTLFLAVNLGATATLTTSLLILGSDFIINLGYSIAVLFYSRDNTEENQKKKSYCSKC